MNLTRQIYESNELYLNSSNNQKLILIYVLKVCLLTQAFRTVTCTQLCIELKMTSTKCENVIKRSLLIVYIPSFVSSSVSSSCS